MDIKSSLFAANNLTVPRKERFRVDNIILI